jgi:hypothetical protein
VVAVSPLVQQEFQAMTRTPVELITNGFDECDFPSEGSVAALGGPSQAFVITHTGLFAADGNPTVLWDVLAEKCQADPAFRNSLKIKLIGKTDDQIFKALKDRGLGDAVVDMGYQPHHVAVQEQMEASVLILPLRKEPEYKAVLPGKLFEYIASRRPVLGIGQRDGAMAMILKEAQAGVVFDWDDKADMAGYIDGCWERHLEGRLSTDGADISRFTRRSTARQMARLFDEYVKDSRSGRE